MSEVLKEIIFNITVVVGIITVFSIIPYYLYKMRDKRKRRELNDK